MRLALPVTLLHLCVGVLAFYERFDESLTINTLQDGKVASKFTFRTLLKGASPRNPKSLDEEDDCEWSGVHNPSRRLNDAPQRSITLYSLSLLDRSFENMQLRNCTFH